MILYRIYLYCDIKEEFICVYFSILRTQFFTGYLLKSLFYFRNVTVCIDRVN